MKPELRNLRISQLQRSLAPFLATKDIPRPQKGWIRAIREVTGITVRELANRLHKAPSVAAHLESSEAEYRITLTSLRKAADALGCELVYALVPKSGNIQELAEKRARSKAADNVRAVEHSMALEDQAVGGIEAKIEQETQRLLKRRNQK
ncbi:MAG: transcriptional regulator [Acidobacteria bacterium]|jgi:predicted DNA-binding mobile mystery protein A|nr:MAG: transcriptional regulator [Acidobacteriota bacterium]